MLIPVSLPFDSAKDSERYSRKHDREDQSLPQLQTENIRHERDQAADYIGDRDCKCAYRSAARIRTFESNSNRIMKSTQRFWSDAIARVTCSRTAPSNP